ncbi:MAG: 3-isopropylmalate dehydratase small subunit [Thaumarchaeota archaeon]|nr:3-isopropylmalate dehydratase small subunit [Nitrososphaerota archaeon]
MEPFKNHRGLVAPLDRANVDTDQIIPKQFLKLIQKTGYGKYLFFDWRFDANGNEKPEFILNQPIYKGASILITRGNFGCGSSREHAVWALVDYGFKAIIGEKPFADIFRNNCIRNGLLPIALSDPEIDTIFNEIDANPGYELEIDLEHQTVMRPTGEGFNFEIDRYGKNMLITGIDEIGMTLGYSKKIDDFESRIAGRIS